jgi:hypothetical protein
MISLLFSSFLLSIYHCQDFLPDLTVYMSKAAGVLKETETSDPSRAPVFFCGSVSFIFLAFCVVLLCVFMCCGIISRFESQCVLYIQYWCIDGKYIIYVARLRNGERRAFSESFHPFRAEPHKFYIYRQYTNIVFILQ